MKKQRKEWKRAGVMSNHHLRPRSRGGPNIESNLLRMDLRRHEAWHLLFSNLSLLEIILLLGRVYKIKKEQAKSYKSLAEL